MTTVYKVCKVASSGKYKSFLYGDADHRMARDYAIGVETVPEFGLLFAFDTLPNALDFLTYSPRGVAVVLMCSAKLESFPFSWRTCIIPSVSRAGYTGCQLFWKDQFFAREIMGPVPDGTVFCSSITPIRVISECES